MDGSLPEDLVQFNTLAFKSNRNRDIIFTLVATHFYTLHISWSDETEPLHAMQAYYN